MPPTSVEARKTLPATSRKVGFANALRGPAAIFVLVSHYLDYAWIMRPQVELMANVKMPSESALATPFFVEALRAIPAFDWGGYGVAIFFLVSGFVIPLSLQKYSARRHRLLLF